MTSIFRSAAIAIILAGIMVTGLLGGGCKNSGPAAKDSAAEHTVKPELARGMQYYKERNYDLAFREFTAAIEKYPDSDTAYFDRAAVFMEQKKYDEAKSDLVQAVAINPRSSGAYYNLASLYSLQNQPDQALQHLDRALQLGFPDRALVMKDPDLNISKIAIETGFRTSQYFAAVFQKQLGRTPSQYRARNLDKKRFKR